jgi:hypothetical protein
LNKRFKMRTFITIIFVFLLSAGIKVRAQEQQPVPYTLADRDRLIKVETEISSVRIEMNAFRNELNARLESQQKQIDVLKTLFFWGFSIIITLIIFMLGYMIWDRRTALKPAL